MLPFKSAKKFSGRNHSVQNDEKLWGYFSKCVKNPIDTSLRILVLHSSLCNLRRISKGNLNSWFKRHLAVEHCVIYSVTC